MNFPYIQNTANANITYSRLNANDIIRKPDLNITRVDYYQGSIKKTKNKSFLKKICTAATFALTGLYIAHRNNLFNPVKREALKIIRNTELQDNVKTFLADKINDANYQKMTRKFLSNLIQDEKTNKEIQKQANNVLSTPKLFEDLSEKIQKTLNDDPSPESLKDGYVVDMLDRLKITVENMLNKNKNNGTEYKNQGETIIKEIFKHADSRNSIADDVFYETVTNRSGGKIQEYLQDLISTEKLGSALI